MPFNPDDFAPKTTGFNPDEFLPKPQVSGFNPDEFLPKEQAFNPDGFLPVTQNDFKAAIPEIVNQLKASLTTGAEFTPQQMKAADGFVPPREAPNFRAMEPEPVYVGGTALTSTLQPGSVETMPFKEQEEAQRQLAAFQAPVRAVAEYKPEFLQNLGQKVLDTSKSLEQANPTGSPMDMARQTISGLDALVGSAIKGATVLDLSLIFGPMVAKEALEAVKTTNWFRKLTVPERGLVLSKFPAMDLPDEQLLKVFKESPEGVQKAMAIHNPRMRQILQTGESTAPIETPLFEAEAAQEGSIGARIAKPVETPATVQPEAVSRNIKDILSDGYNRGFEGHEGLPTKSGLEKDLGVSVSDDIWERYLNQYYRGQKKGQSADMPEAAPATEVIKPSTTLPVSQVSEAAPLLTEISPAMPQPEIKIRMGKSVLGEIETVMDAIKTDKNIPPEFLTALNKIQKSKGGNLSLTRPEAKELLAELRNRIDIDSEMEEYSVRTRWMRTYAKKLDGILKNRAQNELPDPVPQSSPQEVAPEGGVARGGVTPEYVYHGTKKQNLQGIMERGLVPNEGAVSFHKIETSAAHYGKNDGVTLRVKNTNLPNDSFYDENTFTGGSRSAIPAEAIEIKTDAGWVPLKPPPPTPPTAEATPPAPPAKPLSEDGATGPSKQRGFLRTVEESGGTTPGLKEQTLKIDPQEYSQLPNADVLKAADATIAKKGTVRALEDLMATENPSIEDTGVAIRLMKIYEGREDYDKVIPLIDKFDSVFRKSGRTIQLASLWNSLTPSGFVKTIDRSLGKMKVTLDEPFKQMLIKNMSKIKAMPDGPEKSKATFSLLNSVYDKIPFGARLSNLIDAYRYSNMLSSPLTHERNLYGNTLQTFVTKPLDMIGDWGYGLIKHPFNPIARDIQLMDIPKYYQAVFKTIPEAGTAFLDSITSNTVSSKVVESPNEVNFVSEAMRARLPKVLKIIPGIMEATDRFFSIMIASGEKARLMKKGLSESAAELRARDLAEKILYRQKLGEVKKGDVPLLTKALDELGSLVLSARNRPVIGKPISWFAPFITTPINIAKASVERSPLGFIGGKYDNEQMGKALIGSVVSLIGAGAALSGRVTWMPPKNEKERKAFYDSGRTPLSVEIGGKYIPAWYFGPYAISFMLPEAFRYQMQENPQRLTSGNIAAISKAILASGRLITEQTPMAGIKDLTNIMTGRETISSKILARPVSQMIPFVGGLRFIANVIDPIYRKSTGFIDELKKSIPGLTKDLEAYKKLDGTPSTRSLSSQYFPYSINPKDPRADIEFRDIKEKSNRRVEMEEYQRKNKERIGE